MTLIPQNQLSYPAGLAPGFDSTHFAAKNTRLSAVAMASGNFVNLLNGKFGTLTGTPQGSFSSIGPVKDFGNATTDAVLFPAGSSIADAAASVALIWMTDSNYPTGNSELFNNSNSSSGCSIWSSQGGSTLKVQNNSTAIYNTTIPQAANTPYFACITFDGVDNIYTVVVNLNTGALFTATNSASTAGQLRTPASNIQIGNGWNDAAPASSKIAAAAFIGNPLGFGNMLKWAEDPWGFWYPNNTIIKPNDLSVGTASVVVTHWGTTLMMGV